MPNSHLFGVSQNNNLFVLSTNDSCWKEFWSGPSRKIKKISSIPHFVWAIGSDFQVYLYVYGLDVPIIVDEEVFENEVSDFKVTNFFLSKIVLTAMDTN